MTNANAERHNNPTKMTAENTSKINDALASFAALALVQAPGCHKGRNYGRPKLVRLRGTRRGAAIEALEYNYADKAWGKVILTLPGQPRVEEAGLTMMESIKASLLAAFKHQTRSKKTYWAGFVADEVSIVKGARRKMNSN